MRARLVPLPGHRACRPGTPGGRVGMGVGQGGWLRVRIPDCGVKLKGEDDVMVVADLADEAALGAQVAVVDVLGGKFDQGLEESFIHPVRDLWRASAGRRGLLSSCAEPEAVCKTWSAAAPGTLPEELLPQEEFPSTWARKPPRIRLSTCSPCARRNPLYPPLRKGTSQTLTPPSVLPAGEESRRREGAEPCDPGLCCSACLSQGRWGLSHCPGSVDGGTPVPSYQKAEDGRLASVDCRHSPPTPSSPFLISPGIRSF